ncbi:MAG: glycosyltransferase family 39 protein [Bdellovibrionales bacterium]|nr:glycosyltransferase family 39 protein [Bdellovibrionales bacterium]
MTEKRIRNLSPSDVWLWIFCLACLAVGARNFEPGMTIDAPLYASIARNIVRTHEWFRLDGGIPDFQPFAEHPHLGFWLEALVFKVLPAADWSARIPGHCFYVLFLGLIFFFVRKLSGEKTAVFTVLLLWLWGRFANFFSTFYLDPGALCFGFGALVALYTAIEKNSARWAALAGLALALCTLQKGLTVLGFGPACALAVLLHPRPLTWARRFSLASIALLTALSLVGFYAWILSRSSVPNFLSIYWERQMTHRFAGLWSFAGVWHSDFWQQLQRDTLLLPLAFVAIFFVGRGLSVTLPLTLFFSFAAMYAPTHRVGSQYSLMILPWVAWLVATVLAAIPGHFVTNASWIKYSGRLALLATFVVQYIPFRTHTYEPGPALLELRALRDHNGVTTAQLDTERLDQNFITSCPLAWYADVRVEYPNPDTTDVPIATADTAYLVASSPRRIAKEPSLRQRGWCLHRDYGRDSIWLACTK